MAYAKVVVNGTTVMDVTSDTVTASTLINNIRATQANGTKVSGTIQTRSAFSVNPTREQQIAVSAGTYMAGSVTVNAIPNSYVVPSGTYTVTSAGSGIDIKNYASLNVSSASTVGVWRKFSSSTATFNNGASVYPGYISANYGVGTGAFVLPSTSISTITPSTASQVVVSQYTWTLNDVVVEAIPDSYVVPTGTYTVTASGSGINITNYASLNVPSGSYSVRGSLNSSAARVDINGTITAGYQSGFGFGGINIALPSTSVSHITPTSSAQSIIPQYRWTLNEVIVDAIPNSYIIPEGTSTITENGTYPISQYASVIVSVDAGTIANNWTANAVTPTENTQTINIPDGYTGLNAVTVNGISSTYVGTGITKISSTNVTVAGQSVTAPAGYYSSAITKAVTVMTLPTSTSTGTIGTGPVVTIGRSTGTRYLNIPIGYNTTSRYYTISSVPNGTVVPPTTITGTSATVTTGTNTLTFTSSISLTPNVTTAGYISAGTASTRTVTLTANITPRTSTAVTANGSTVTIPAGYYATQVTKNVSSIAHPAPTVSINTTTGVITASHQQSAGYVAAGTTSATLSLPIQAAKTVTPTESSQTAVAANTYTTGVVTVGPIPSVYKPLSSTTTASAADIIETKTAYNSAGQFISGTMHIMTYYSGSTVPPSSLGQNGDVYLQM